MTTREKRLATLSQISREFNKLVEEADEALAVLQHELKDIHVSMSTQLTHGVIFGFGKIGTRTGGSEWMLYINEPNSTYSRIEDASPIARVIAAQGIDVLLQLLVERVKDFLKHVRLVTTKAGGEETVA